MCKLLADKKNKQPGKTICPVAYLIINLVYFVLT